MVLQEIANLCPSGARGFDSLRRRNGAESPIYTIGDWTKDKEISVRFLEQVHEENLYFNTEWTCEKAACFKNGKKQN